MGPKRLHVDENNGNDYASEGEVVIPKQSATPQTANLLGQSSLKREKAGVEEGHLQKGE